MSKLPENFSTKETHVYIVWCESESLGCFVYSKAYQAKAPATSLKNRLDRYNSNPAVKYFVVKSLLVPVEFYE